MTKEIVTVLAAKPGPAAHIDRLLAVCQRERLSVAQTAYVLATAHHESRMGLVMLDRASGWAYEGHMHLGNVQPGDGPRFRGRGYILLIGRTSYLRWARYLDQPLVDQPGLAAEPEVAAEILVLGMKYGRFTGRTLAEFLNESVTDYVGARKVVDSQAQAGRVANIARRFEATLRNESPAGPPASAVIEIQRQLRTVGWPLVVDGIFGTISRQALRDFQVGYAFSQLRVDGAPDPQTLSALRWCAANGGHASEHFRFVEFRTRGSQQISINNHVIRVQRRLVLALEQYRRATGGPVHIASAYQSVACNNRIQGSVQCQHLLGTAADVANPCLSVPEVAALGVFDSIGVREGLAVHLAVAGEQPVDRPEILVLD